MNKYFFNNNNNPEFNPATQISGCFAQWKATNNTTLTSGKVTTWADTVNGYVLTQSNLTNAPTIVESDKNIGISFNGSTNIYSTLPASSWNFLHQTGSIAIAIQGRSNNNLQGLYSTDYIFTGGTGTNLLLNHVAVGTYFSTISISASSPQIWQNQYIGGYPGPNRNSYIIQTVNSTTTTIQATRLAYLSVAHGLSTTAGNATVTLTLGDIFSGGGYPYTGLIFEVLCFNRVLTQTEFAQIANYFTAKYGCEL